MRRARLGSTVRRPLPNTVVVSTIGAALEHRGIGVGELQRRLAERGINVSRGALDRLASNRPIKVVNFELLVPVLEELGIELGEPFMALPSQEHERQRTARALALQTARSMANGHTEAAQAALSDAADEADAGTAAQLDALIRRQHPEVFDSRGRLRRRALARALATRFGGTRLTRDQVDDVIAAGRDAAARRRGQG
jgi:hypothetical protein